MVLQEIANPLWAGVHPMISNHEQTLLDFMDGLSATWLHPTYGSDATLRSYGIEAKGLNASVIRSKMIAKIPQEHIEFLRTQQASFRLGNLLFVHAGVRPGIALKDQAYNALERIHLY